MSDEELLQRMLADFEAIPIPGTPDYIIHVKDEVLQRPIDPNEPPVDWDQFERDVNAARGRIGSA